MTSLGILPSLTQPHPARDTGPSWTWAPAIPPAILVPVCIWQLDQEEPARARKGEGGSCHTTQSSAPPGPMWFHCGEPCIRKEGDRQDLVSPCWLGPGLRSLTGPSHPNCVDFPSSGFSICRVGQAPYLQPACFWEDGGQRN